MRIDNPTLPHKNHGNLSLAENLPVTTVVRDNPRVRISSADLTGVTTADFTLPSGFHFYEFIIRGLVPVTGGADLGLQVSTDGGSTFASGASDYAYALFGGDTTTSGLSQIDAANSFILLNQTTNGLGTTGTQVYCGRVLVCNAYGNRMFPMIHCYSSNAGSTGLQTYASVAGNYQTAGNAAINAIRFLLNSGNFERGFIHLYGIR
jgi:hypothetical protein